MSSDLIRQQYEDTLRENIHLTAQLAERDARIVKLIAAGDGLDRYTEHTNDCQIVTHGVWSAPIPCTCGFDEAGQAWTEAKG